MNIPTNVTETIRTEVKKTYNFTPEDNKKGFNSGFDVAELSK